MKSGALLIFVALLASAPRSALAAEPCPQYKDGESWPLRNAQGLDLLEPLFPLVAVEREDWGRLAFVSILPAALFTGAYALRPSDRHVTSELRSKHYLGVDEDQDNNILLFGTIAGAALLTLVPSPEDRCGYLWDLRLDRITVFAAGMVATAAIVEALKPLLHEHRPEHGGHAAVSWAAAAYASGVIRDWLRPQDETSLGFRILLETASAVPYLAAAFVSLERVHHGKHALTDVLLGGAIGATVMNVFYAWSFTRVEQGRHGLELSMGWDGAQRGFTLALSGGF